MSCQREKLVDAFGKVDNYNLYYSYKELSSAFNKKLFLNGLFLNLFTDGRTLPLRQHFRYRFDSLTFPVLISHVYVSVLQSRTFLGIFDSLQLGNQSGLPRLIIPCGNRTVKQTQTDKYIK